MPRKRSQPIAAPQDQAYGQRGDQMAAQHAIPLPNERGVAPDTGSAPTPGAPLPQGAPAPMPMPMPAAAPDPMAAALGMMPPDPSAMLDAPTQRPGEPVTAGLSIGEGPGREVNPLLVEAQRPTPAANALDIIAAANGNDPMITRLAAAARLRRQ